MDMEKTQLVAAVIIAAALLVNAGMIMVAVNKQSPENDTQDGWVTNETIYELNTSGGKIKTVDGTTITVTGGVNKVTQLDGGLRVTQGSALYFVPMDQIAHIWTS